MSDGESRGNYIVVDGVVKLRLGCDELNVLKK